MQLKQLSTFGTAKLYTVQYVPECICVIHLGKKCLLIRSYLCVCRRNGGIWHLYSRVNNDQMERTPRLIQFSGINSNKYTAQQKFVLLQKKKNRDVLSRQLEIDEVNKFRS